MLYLQSTPTLFTQSSTERLRVLRLTFSDSNRADTDRTNRFRLDLPVAAMDPARVLLLMPSASLSHVKLRKFFRLPVYSPNTRTPSPASFVIVHCTFSGISFSSSTIWYISDSREAVPFPRNQSNSVFLDKFLHCFFCLCNFLRCCRRCRINNRCACLKLFPVSSTTASLRACAECRIRAKYDFICNRSCCINNCSKFLPKTVIAPSSAFSRQG